MSKAAATQRGIERQNAIPLDQRMVEATEERIQRALELAARFAAKQYGLEVEPYVGADDFKDRYGPWQRICVGVQGLELNYRAATDKKPQAFCVFTRCQCGDLVSVDATRPEWLAFLANGRYDHFCEYCREAHHVRWTEAK